MERRPAVVTQFAACRDFTTNKTEFTACNTRLSQHERRRIFRTGLQLALVTKPRYTDGHRHSFGIYNAPLTCVFANRIGQRHQQSAWRANRIDQFQSQRQFRRSPI